ncbi:MAG: GvpL/GvpF family gas vesicle protein [Micromonosporaceae bacterium]
MLHVYGVMRPGATLPGLPGVGEPPGELRLVDWQDLAAVVSPLVDETQLTDQDAVRHLDVLTTIVAEHDVLPLPFGVAAPDDSAVREEVLEQPAPDLRARLEALRGHVELRVDLTFDEEQALRQVLAEHPELSTAMGPDCSFQERVQLGEQISAQLAARTSEQGERMMAGVIPLAADTHREAGGAPTLDRWSLLVPRSRVAEVDQGVHALGDHAHLQVEYVGPLPPYSFLGRSDATSRPAGEGGWGASGSGRWGW